MFTASIICFILGAAALSLGIFNAAGVYFEMGRLIFMTSLGLSIVFFSAFLLSDRMS